MSPEPDLHRLTLKIKAWARGLGFQQAGITDTSLDTAERYLQRWLDRGHHGDMGYMARHGTKRSRPMELEPGTLRIISLRMDYRPEEILSPDATLNDPKRAYISRYALGRDYHKLMRKRLQRLAQQIESEAGPIK